MTTSDTQTTAPRRTQRLRETALNLAALAGLVCILATAVGLFLGVKPLVFRSGSMEPTISTGALALATSVPAGELAVGDVVSVVGADGVRITHRVVDLTPAADGAQSVTMRGDANGADDPSPYLLSDADRVFFHVDTVGYVVAWLSSPVAIFLGGMLAGGLFVLAFGRTRSTDDAAASSHDTDVPVMEETHHG